LKQKTESDKELVLRGTIQRVTFRNPSNGYSVLKLQAAESNELLTVTGFCLSVATGSYVMARGNYRNHPKYGSQFVATEITETTPTSCAGLEKYLSSDLIKGIGPKTASLLVERFGTEVIQIIKTDPQRIAKVPGIGEHRAHLLCQALSSLESQDEVRRYFIERNLSVTLTNRIIEKYGLEAIKKVSADPYVLAHEMRGIGFATADSIAFGLGFEADSEERLRAGVFWTLQKAAEKGHCFYPKTTLMEETHRLLGLNQQYNLDLSLRYLEEHNHVIVENENVYLADLYTAETYVAHCIAKRCRAWERPLASPELVEESLTNTEKELNLKFSAAQRSAAEKAVRFPLLVITGGPGCGKTTIIRALVAMFQKLQMNIALTAPTGKAAQRMAELSGKSAQTIHRLLKFDPFSQSFQYGPDNPLNSPDNPSKVVDVVIVDETSMVDINLAQSLFSALSANTSLILVGDKDQLPSVGPGRVFAEILAEATVPTVNLAALFRRSETSRITDIAHMINSGIVPEIPCPDGSTKSDAYFIPKSDPVEIAALVENLVAQQVPEKFGILPEDITVLSPSNRGPLGIEELNRHLQQRLNGDCIAENCIQTGHNEFRVGDRVCQRKNNYHIDPYGVFNGDMGYIHEINSADQSLVVDLWDGRLIKYDRKDLKQLSLAYALTVHRSQGSELPCVILVLHDSHYVLLERQLLYTGVTRAKNLLIVIGSRKALAIASKRRAMSKRFTSLQERISIQLSNKLK
jgi:exodeoxyribonuclease V alpha subunit